MQNRNENNESKAKKELLLIDDDTEFSEYFFEELTEKLSCNNVIMKYAQDPQKGYTTCRDNNVCIIILDYQLGDGMDGIDFLKKRDEIKCRVPVIALTGHSDVLQSMKAHGAFDACYKDDSSDFERCLQTINDILCYGG